MAQPTIPAPSPTDVPTKPGKLAVLPKIAPFTAVALAADQPVQLADGRTMHGTAGDWLIARGRVVIDLCGPANLADRYQIVDGNDRLLSAAIRTRLEETLGIGTTRTPEDLIAAVERLAKIEIGGIRIDFTPGQLDEIKYRATKRGQSVQQALQAVIDRIREDLFWRS